MDARGWEIDPTLLKGVAEHLLFVSEVGQKMRCPVCHGKPSTTRWKNRHIKRKYYGCGCGHQWDQPSRSEAWRLQWTYGTQTLLTNMTVTGELPEVPEKIREG